MGKRTTTWTRLASVGFGLCAACGAAGDDGGAVAVRPDAPRGGGSSEDTPAPSGPPAAPPTNVGGPTFNVDAPSQDGVTPMGCQQAERRFEPNIPSVYLVVDRSGTMFDPIVNNVSAWSALRGGVLQVMRELESNVSFGFAAFSGQNISAGGALQCDLELPSVPPALNNYAAIATLYEPLERPASMNQKETPTVLALQEIAEQLRADPSTGDKYILFVTDGEPDYCDDGNAICPPDSVVGLLQELASEVDASGAAQAPIKTLIFGITSPTATIREDVLQAFANAGAGLPVLGLAPDPNSIYDQCAVVPAWAADFATTGKPTVRGQTIGEYVYDATLAGNAAVYRPDPTDQAALTDQIRTALAAVKSCTFDLGEDGVQVDLARQDLGERARVIINGTPVPFDPANGWSMESETTVTLAGAACDTWRDPTVETSIQFDFPCDIFVPR